jgi:hypothetical protein
MASKLAQLRSDQKLVMGCLGLSAVVLGSLAVQRMGQAQGDKAAQARQQHLQQQASEFALQQQSEAQRRQAIEANANAWKAWQSHVSQRCSAVVHKLNADQSYLGVTIGKERRPLYPGVILCDRDYAGILKGPELRLHWVVPRVGSKMPMPTGDPPPEFKPPVPVQIVQ